MIQAQIPFGEFLDEYTKNFLLKKDKILSIGGAVALLSLRFAMVPQWLFPAVTTAVSSGISVLIGTASLTGVVAPWIIQSGTTILLATTAVTMVTLSVKAIEKAKSEPFRWGAAVLALVTPFLTHLCEEFGNN